MKKHTIRKCPVCHIVLRRVLLCENVEVEICQSCRGIWFDKDEIDHTYKTPQLPPLFLSERKGLRDPSVCVKCHELNTRSIRKCSNCGFQLEFRCPYCLYALEEVRVGDVIADRCNQCRGVWLDGGELLLLFNFYKKQTLNRSKAGLDPYDTLEFLFWTTHLSDAGAIVIDAAAHAPEVVGDVLEHVGDIPELAGQVFSGTANVAGHVVDVSGELISGAIDLAGNVPEVAASAADACSGFFEALIGLIAGIFD